MRKHEENEKHDVDIRMSAEMDRCRKLGTAHKLFWARDGIEQNFTRATGTSLQANAMYRTISRPECWDGHPPTSLL
jgi:hypothetical protein